MAIHLRSGDELEKMHRAGLVVYDVLTALREFVRPGLTTMDLGPTPFFRDVAEWVVLRGQEAVFFLRL